MNGFKEIQSTANFAGLEKEHTDRWEKLGVVEMLKKARSGCEEKVYYDGPITANNMPHYGHAITWTLKDIIPRYWSMRGYFVSRNMGWDCQGIPVEWEVEKELGFKDKRDIEKFGVAKFNELCKKSVFRYRDSIFQYERQLGRWFDNADMYYTMDKNYIESMWWSLKVLYEKGLLYEGHKVVAYSTRAGTPLSTHEVKDGGYLEMEDPYVIVKFKLNDLKHPDTYFLAWTTTPWTIPGNLLLALSSKIKYVKVTCGGERYIIAKDCVDAVFKGKACDGVEDIPAKSLLNMEYQQPFDFFEKKRSEGCFKVVEAAHITTDEGTGIVHLAPYGAEDFDVFMTLGIPLFDYLDETGNFNQVLPKYAGLFYKDANQKIIADLKESDALFDTGTLLHRMPMCYRTKTPLIYKPIKSWYLAVTKIKAKMIKENRRINWVPQHVRDGNSGQWIENAKDWSLSRQRYWGTPLPIWINDATGEIKFIGSFAQLKDLSGVAVVDPHKPFVDEITWKDEKYGGTFRRIPDVIDVWYDSGSVPFAKLHYPFENKDVFEKRFPADYISEGMDQTHLWFYTMHVLGVALFDRIPFENVVVNGMMLDKNGDKLSKSKGNFLPMDTVLEQYGADVLRYFITTSPIVQGEFARFYEDALATVRKEFFLLVWNSLKYFLTYAKLHNYAPSLAQPTSPAVLDVWILARLQETINAMCENLDKYLIMNAAKALAPFAADLSTWYIRRSRERLKLGDLAALGVLYYTFVIFSKLMAPILPFLSETLYSLLNANQLSGLDSVHLDLYPERIKLTAAQEEVLKVMTNTRRVVSLALSVRDTAGIGVRQPLETLFILSKKEQMRIYDELVKDDVNVKNVVMASDAKELPGGLASAKDGDVFVHLDLTLSQELKEAGAVRELVRKIQDMRKRNGLGVTQKVSVVVDGKDVPEKLLLTFGDVLKQKVLATKIIRGDKYELTPQD